LGGIAILFEEGQEKAKLLGEAERRLFLEMTKRRFEIEGTPGPQPKFRDVPKMRAAIELIVTSRDADRR